MATCPRCQASIAGDSIKCPRCQLPLKAHGHPGIPLHRADQGESLCLSCQYHFDDSCTYPQRPVATTCTLYQPVSTAPSPSSPPAEPTAWKIQRWLGRHGALIAITGLLGLSLLLVLSR
ncbi:hypothetical protein C7271_11960 [filamentous cyanobacterium CCP5]|nr:hypothetical protein C7271_11960 [filamentous cyanobacterium CCP5]